MSDDLSALAARGEWLLDPDVAAVNHGSFGATPRRVLAEQDRWRERMERHPTGFMSFELPPALREAADQLAAFVSCHSDDLVFVENATAGCNAVLNSVRLGTGDEILLTDHTYGAVRKAAIHVARCTGARVVEASVPFPLADQSDIIAAVAARLSQRTRLAVLDHVTSPTALIFPVAELAALCHAAGALILIDGAHAPGMLDLDIAAVGADFYVGNCHKWLMAPKGAGFLWATPAHQAVLHPPVISHGYGQGFVEEFAWVGTRDPTAWLAVPAAIAFHQALGGPALRERNARLARQSATLLASAWRTQRGAPDALTGAMAAIQLPTTVPATAQCATQLRRQLFYQHRIELPVTPFAGALWGRISAHAYNEPEDYRRLMRAFAQ